MITIPFRPQFHDLMDSGIKKCTARSKKYGNEGDIFENHGKQFRLVDVRRQRLDVIAERYWSQEGCNSKDHFIEIWKEIHPSKGFVPEQEVWLHWFEPLEATP